MLEDSLHQAAMNPQRSSTRCSHTARMRRRWTIWVDPAALGGGGGHAAIVDRCAHGADVKAVEEGGRPAARGGGEWPQRNVDALLNAGAVRDGKDNGRIAGRLRQEGEAPDNRRKCDPAFAKAEGEKLRKAFAEATTVHVLSTRFNEPSEEGVCGVAPRGPK